MTAALREDAAVSRSASDQIRTSVREPAPPVRLEVTADDVKTLHRRIPELVGRVRQQLSSSPDSEAGPRRRPLRGTTVAGRRATVLPRPPAVPSRWRRQDRHHRGDAGIRRRPDGLRAAEQRHGRRRARAPVARLIQLLAVCRRQPVSGAAGRPLSVELRPELPGRHMLDSSGGVVAGGSGAPRSVVVTGHATPMV
jgi:hypothetical protein